MSALLLATVCANEKNGKEDTRTSVSHCQSPWQQHEPIVKRKHQLRPDCALGELRSLDCLECPSVRKRAAQIAWEFPVARQEPNGVHA
ncbi:unnamed protein product [Protopolystoma xenopodis]|uniref:Uncharacterized protein n=1 Tax=Protopolystoma xenopodis TaxID=117903 RepID=A0A3S4ZT61_9PLAT|nr:unnamed protein product [Protopolystoma xenopodis]